MDELRCHNNWGQNGSEPRCPNEATWILRVKSRSCGHSWFDSTRLPNDRPEQSQMYCEVHIQHYATWHLFPDLSSCQFPDCGGTMVRRDSFVSLERL